MRGGNPSKKAETLLLSVFSPRVRGLREGVTGSAAADAFLSDADPLRAASLTQAGQNVFIIPSKLHKKIPVPFTKRRLHSAILLPDHSF